MVRILQEADAGEKKLTQLCLEKGTTKNTFFVWKAKYGGIVFTESKRIKELEREDARLKKLLAERDLDVDILKELVAKNF